MVRGLVLVVEDDPDISLMMSLSLRLAGHEVHSAPTGEAALATLATERPNVLVLDLGLPGIGGREVLRRVRENPLLEGLPVVVVSAHAVATVAEMMTLGCDRYLTKPFDPRELVRTVNGLGAGPVNGLGAGPVDGLGAGPVGSAVAGDGASGG